MLTLGIETSCDETSVSVTDDRKVLANEVTSSVEAHSKYGGVVPEIASRYHVEYINYLLDEALGRAGRRLKDIKLVAVTNGPGLVGALLIGVSAAKAISYALGVPLIGVNHIIAHLYSVSLDKERALSFPFAGLAVSGGHTSLYHCKGFARNLLLGATQDDALGEAFDKVAKILKLGYPGGPIIEKTARSSRGEVAIRFPKSYLEKDSLDFSFSGVKTAVLYYVKEHGLKGKRSAADICRAFQDSALDVVVDKAILACKKTRSDTLVVGGGVSANGVLRQKMQAACGEHGIKAYFPEMRFCQDNAAMIGMLGEELYKRGARSGYSLTAYPNLK